jgi:hypothetical protein
MSAASSPSSRPPPAVVFWLAKSLRRSSSAGCTRARLSRIREPAPCLSNGPSRSWLSLTPLRPLSSSMAGPSPFASKAISRIAIPGKRGLPSPVAATRSITSVASPMVATRSSSKPCATSMRRNGQGLLGETLCCGASAMAVTRGADGERTCGGVMAARVNAPCRTPAGSVPPPSRLPRRSARPDASTRCAALRPGYRPR